METVVRVIAIDGPAGAGKSTVAQAVAERMGFDYLDTGAMYRAVALETLRRGVDPDDAAAVGRIASEIDLRVTGERIFIGVEDVSRKIRSAEVTRAVSLVSTHPEVRTQMVRRQREVAAGRNVVVEGRDIGSVVFPDADAKVYLTASIEERARRRTDQLALDRDLLEEIRTDLWRRDEVDSTRPESPLTRAPDAVEVDSTDKTVEQVVDEIEMLVSGP
ncbi:MAG: (d)CMP kinase [Actinobacteria bacterium]|nr:(d)CMP kinase [Actinomycetota bacterium]